MDLDNMQRYKESYTSKSTRYIKIYHQNIRGLGMKSGEILGNLHPDYPQVLCLTEHHLKKFQIKFTVIENYNLGANHSIIRERTRFDVAENFPLEIMTLA
jgi:hypothetical protein